MQTHKRPEIYNHYTKMPNQLIYDARFQVAPHGQVAFMILALLYSKPYYARVSIQDLVEETGVSRATIARGISTAKMLGWLIIENGYRVLVIPDEANVNYEKRISKTNVKYESGTEEGGSLRTETDESHICDTKGSELRPVSLINETDESHICDTHDPLRPGSNGSLSTPKDYIDYIDYKKEEDYKSGGSSSKSKFEGETLDSPTFPF